MPDFKSLNWPRIGLHALFWAVYLPLNAVLTCIMYRQPLDLAFWQALEGETYSLPVKMALTYFIFYYIIPLYLERNKVYKLILLLLLGFAAAIIAYRFVLGYIYFAIYPPKVPYNFFDARGLLLTAFDCFITSAAACTIKFIRLHYASVEFEQQLIREKLESELNFLRAQTNPHFLFNTLNNLYVLAWKKSDKTAAAIMMLSKIMRFVLYECRVPRIAVSQETQIIHDYIELEKLRYNDRLHVTYEVEIDNPETSIAPLMLLPFVENSFKHGANSTTGDVRIIIRLLLQNRKLYFEVRNTVDPDPAPSGNSNGIGLKNVVRQLDLLYSGQHHLNIQKENEQFRVVLEIDLGEF
jgi:two-component system, LytTR family, sensor kinase